MLRRERVGRFAAAQAIPLASLREIGHREPSGGTAEGGPAPILLAQLKPIETALDGIPALALTGGEADRLKQGRPVPVLRGEDRAAADTIPEGTTLYAMAEGKIVALLRRDGALAHPLRLFNL
jgi:tRNA pseudouridine55 synthase